MLLGEVVAIGFGLVIGSFLNVCIYRIPRGKSIVLPPSACPHCRAQLRAWQNIPVISYLVLGGRCRECQHPISPTYPVVECWSALSFWCLYLKYGLSAPFFYNVFFFSLLLVLIFIDLYHRLLPNVLTLGGLLVGLAASPLQSREFLLPMRMIREPDLGPWDHLLGSLLGIVVGGGFLWLVATLYLRLRRIEGMGFGDIKMMAMVGAFLGWRYAWLTILMGSLLGALVGSVYIFLLGKGRRYELPFGSFLGLGAMLVTLWGRAFLVWYLG